MEATRCHRNTLWGTNLALDIGRLNESMHFCGDTWWYCILRSAVNRLFSGWLFSTFILERRKICPHWNNHPRFGFVVPHYYISASLSLCWLAKYLIYCHNTAWDALISLDTSIPKSIWLIVLRNGIRKTQFHDWDTKCSIHVRLVTSYTLLFFS